MLILTRRVGETLMIGDEVTVTVLGVKGNQVRIGVNAPRDVAWLEQVEQQRRRADVGKNRFARRQFVTAGGAHRNRAPVAHHDAGDALTELEAATAAFEQRDERIGDRLRAADWDAEPGAARHHAKHVAEPRAEGVVGPHVGVQRERREHSLRRRAFELAGTEVASAAEKDAGEADQLAERQRGEGLQGGKWPQ